MHMVKDMKSDAAKVFIDNVPVISADEQQYFFIIDTSISTTDEKYKKEKEVISFHFMEFFIDK